MSDMPNKPLMKHHVALKVFDFDRSIQFYTECLGMKVLKIWGEGAGAAAMIDIGDGMCIEMFAGGEKMELSEKAAGSFIHFAFAVDDPKAWHERALSFGAVSTMDPTDMFIETSADPLDICVAFVKGPDGEILEFFQDKTK